MKTKFSLPLCFIILHSSFIIPAFAQGTAFTYQGWLNDGANPASGNYDLRFTIYDSTNIPGNVVAGPLTNSPTSVSNGLFTVTLDFGAGVFDGNPRWLEISVETNGNVGGFTLLSLRQSLTPTPYAIYSVSAATAASVAPGAVAPGQLSTPVPPADNQVLSYSGGSLLWTDPVAGRSIWSLSLNNVDAYYNAGNVGIGTSNITPGIRLQVNGNTLMTPGGTGGNIQFGTPGAETGMTIIGSNRADLRFDGQVLKLLAGPGQGVPSAANGIVINTNGKVGIGTTSSYSKLAVVTSTSGGAIVGTTTGGGIGVSGTSSGAFAYGVYGTSSGYGVGVQGFNPDTTNGYAGHFAGNMYVSHLVSFGADLHVSGLVSKGGGSFKIDHPLDPANKYLSHSFVESPDMMNIYNGNIALDAAGEAVVQLPEWFESLNKDFRYQLTAISAPGPNLYIAEEIAGNQFKIAGGRPGSKVSWQVTGVRQDAFANAHRIKVEEEKTGGERGHYLHPELFGQPSEKSIAEVRR